MEGHEEDVGDHVGDIEGVGVEEAPAAAAAETPDGSQPKRKCAWLLGAPFYRNQLMIVNFCLARNV